MSDDLVSVIIPVYNGVRYLAEAVASVHRQGYTPLEIIIVDDGSTDGSFAAALELPGVRCFQQENGGAASARNRGVQEARGEVLTFLDADDLWTEGKLRLQLDALAADPTLGLVAGRVEDFYMVPSARTAAREQQARGERAYTLGALLVRRADFHRVGWFNPALRFGELMDWRSRALACGLKELMLDAVLLRRRIHDRNTTLISRGSRADYAAAIRAHLERNRAGK